MSVVLSTGTFICRYKMKITKDGITRSIDASEWAFFCEKGWHKIGCPEPQPSQEGLYIIDDYTIGLLDSKVSPK